MEQILGIRASKQRLLIHTHMYMKIQYTESMYKEYMK